MPVEQTVRDLIKQINTTLSAGISVSSLVLGTGDNAIGRVKITDGSEVASVNASNQLETSAAQNGTWNVTNVSGTVSLPTGASTLAEQQTQTTHLATVAGDTTAIQTAIELIDDTVVTVAAAVPTKGIAFAGTDGTNGRLIKTDSSGELQIDVLTMPTTTVQATDLDIRNLTATDVVTAELSATDNAVLDAIAASVAAIDTDATTIIGHVDGLEGLIGTTNTNTGNIVTSVQLIDDTVVTLGTDTYTEATSKGFALGAVRRDADTTLVNTTNEWGPLQMDANGRLKTEVFSGETLPVSLASVPSHAVTNAGTFAVQVDGAALTALQLIDNTIIVDDATFSPATTSVNMAGFFADESSTDSVDEGDGGAARMTLDRKQIVNPQPHTAGGTTIFRSLDLDESEEEVKATAGNVYGMMFTNTASTTRWLKFYNATAANVTVGSTTPVITIGLPGNTSDDISGLFSNGGLGIGFDTAITVAATTGVADADTGAPSANDVIINIFYK